MRDRITKITIGTAEYYGIEVGDDKTGAPKLQGVRQKGLIISGDEITEWDWHGITSVGDRVYAFFDPCSIEGLETIATSNRDNALMLIEEIAYGLLHADKGFLSLEGDVFPLYRIFILERTKILLLPPDLGNILAIARIGERRREEVGNLVKENILHSYGLILEMAELMYFAAAGIFPYALHEVRSNHFQEIPLSFLSDELDPSAADLINTVLHAGNRKMRDICGNRKGQENLGWFLQHALSVSWNLRSITEEESERRRERAEESEEYKEFFEKAARTAKRRDFWRVKGTLITAAAAVALIIIAVSSSVLYNSLKAPGTKDMSQEEMLVHFYEAQNDLDITEMSEGVKASIPQESEVMNLFVTRQTRMAYENKNTQVNAEKWINSGRPAIEETCYVYGTVIEKTELIGDDKWNVEAIWYTPYPYEKERENEDVSQPGKATVYSYRVNETFTFEWNRRGWWNITDIEITGYEFLGIEYADTYKKESSTLLSST